MVIRTPENSGGRASQQSEAWNKTLSFYNNLISVKLEKA
jgi:hypothetical protein